MAKIPEKMRWIYDLLLTAAILATATVLCTLLRRIDDGSGYVNLIFVLAVATISRWTEGYFWGIFSAVSGVLFVNYVFTYPYWEFNFTITGYPFTFLAMLTVSMMISAMNTQIKKQERLRIETEKEAVRANLLRAMSHDIRTPLTSIVGNTAAILENEDSFSPEQKRRLLEDVNEDAQWLIRMVENLLSITRMSGRTGKDREGLRGGRGDRRRLGQQFSKRFPGDQGFDRGAGRGADGADGRDAHPSGHYESAGKRRHPRRKRHADPRLPLARGDERLLFRQRQRRRHPEGEALDDF